MYVTQNVPHGAAIYKAKERVRKLYSNVQKYHIMQPLVLPGDVADGGFYIQDVLNSALRQIHTISDEKLGSCLVMILQWFFNRLYKWNAINLKCRNRSASRDVNFYKAFFQGFKPSGNRMLYTVNKGTEKGFPGLF